MTFVHRFCHTHYPDFWVRYNKMVKCKNFVKTNNFRKSMYHANSKLQLKYRIKNFNPSWNVLKRPVLEDNGWPFENYELWCYCGSTLLRVCSSNLSKTNIQKYFNHFNVSMCLKQTTLALYNVIEMIMIPTYLWIQS